MLSNAGYSFVDILFQFFQVCGFVLCTLFFYFTSEIKVTGGFGRDRESHKSLLIIIIKIDYGLLYGLELFHLGIILQIIFEFDELTELIHMNYK